MIMHNPMRKTKAELVEVIEALLEDAENHEKAVKGLHYTVRELKADKTELTEDIGRMALEITAQRELLEEERGRVARLEQWYRNEQNLRRHTEDLLLRLARGES